MKLNEIYMRDTFMYIEDGIGYLIGTTDTTAWGGKASGFLGYKTKDMENFEGPYVLFSNNDSFWADENFWAPELHKIDGKYYILASFKKKGKCRASQALVCDTPFGKYIPSKKPFTPSNLECLDATFYKENNEFYTIFCNEWTQCKDGKICLAKLNKDLTETFDIKELFSASSASWSIPFGTNNDCYVTDGPFIYKGKNGRLFMLWSSTSVNGYAIGYSYSDDGINGPWIHSDKTLYDGNGGHGMIFEFNGKKYLIIHCPNSPSLSERPLIKEIIESSNYLYLKES